MRKKTIVLFYPRSLHEKNYRYFHVPYSLLAVASSLDPHKHDVVVIDDNVAQKESYESELRGSEILCVGISSMIGAQIKGALRFAKAVRELNVTTPVIWGGALPTMLPNETAANPCVDIAVEGQGEITFLELVQRLSSNRSPMDVQGISYRKEDGEVVRNAARPFKYLSAFPSYTKSYPLINLKNYIWHDEHIASRTVSYHSSQGCPFGCGFCCEVSLWHRWWSGLPAARVLDDVQYLVDQFDVNGVKFYDSEFFVDRKRAIDFGKGIIARKLDLHWAASIHPQNLSRISDEELVLLRQSGLTRLLIGAESGVQEELRLIGKCINKDMIYAAARRCAKNGIFVCFTFVTGYPSMPGHHIDDTLAFADDLHRFEPMHEAKLHFFGPYPGAPLYQLALDYGFQPPTSLEEWSDYDYYNILTPWIDKEYETRLREFNETHYPYIRPFQGG